VFTYRCIEMLLVASQGKGAHAGGSRDPGEAHPLAKPKPQPKTEARREARDRAKPPASKKAPLPEDWQPKPTAFDKARVHDLSEVQIRFAVKQFKLKGPSRIVTSRMTWGRDEAQLDARCRWMSSLT
jgi:hypothetical protein